MFDPDKKIRAYFYRSSAGHEPVRAWLMDMERDDRRIMGKDIQKAEYGWPVGMPCCRSLGKGLWEVRSNLTRGRISRVIFFILEDRMILLHGFIKKTRRTPEKEISLALKRKGEVERS